MGVLGGLLGRIIQLLFELLKYLYNLFLYIANVRIFSTNADGELIAIKTIFSHFQVLLYIIMVFYISFEVVKYTISPDTAMDKEKGAGGLLKRVVITIMLMAFMNQIFAASEKLRSNLINSNVIQQIILPSKNDDQFSNRNVNPGGQFAGSVLELFYVSNAKNLSNNGCSSCNPDTCTGENTNCCSNNCNQGKAKSIYNYCLAEFKGKSATKPNVDINSDQFTDCDKLGFEIYTSSVNPIVKVNNFIVMLATVIFCGWVLLQYCVENAKNVFKLAFLQAISPIPIMCYLSPDKDGVFPKWSKLVISAYLDTIIRIAILYFTAFICNLLMTTFKDLTLFKGIEDAGYTDISGGTKIIIVAFLLIGLFYFAMEAPKLIKDMMPKSLQGSFGGAFGIGKESRAARSKALSKALGAAKGGVRGTARGLAAARHNFKGADGKYSLKNGLDKLNPYKKARRALYNARSAARMKRAQAEEERDKRDEINRATDKAIEDAKQAKRDLREAKRNNKDLYNRAAQASVERDSVNNEIKALENIAQARSLTTAESNRLKMLQNRRGQLEAVIKTSEEVSSRTAELDANKRESYKKIIDVKTEFTSANEARQKAKQIMNANPKDSEAYRKASEELKYAEKRMKDAEKEEKELKKGIKDYSEEEEHAVAAENKKKDLDEKKKAALDSEKSYYEKGREYTAASDASSNAKKALDAAKADEDSIKNAYEELKKNVGKIGPDGKPTTEEHVQNALNAWNAAKEKTKAADDNYKAAEENRQKVADAVVEAGKKKTLNESELAGILNGTSEDEINNNAVNASKKLDEISKERSKTVAEKALAEKQQEYEDRIRKPDENIKKLREEYVGMKEEHRAERAKEMADKKTFAHDEHYQSVLGGAIGGFLEGTVDGIKNGNYEHYFDLPTSKTTRQNIQHVNSSIANEIQHEIKRETYYEQGNDVSAGGAIVSGISNIIHGTTSQQLESGFAPMEATIKTREATAKSFSEVAQSAGKTKSVLVDNIGKNKNRDKIDETNLAERRAIEKVYDRAGITYDEYSFDFKNNDISSLYRSLDVKEAEIKSQLERAATDSERSKFNDLLERFKAFSGDLKNTAAKITHSHLASDAKTMSDVDLISKYSLDAVKEYRRERSVFENMTESMKKTLFDKIKGDETLLGYYREIIELKNYDNYEALFGLSDQLDIISTDLQNSASGYSTVVSQAKETAERVSANEKGLPADAATGDGNKSGGSGSSSGSSK